MSETLQEIIGALSVLQKDYAEGAKCEDDGQIAYCADISDELKGVLRSLKRARARNVGQMRAAVTLLRRLGAVVQKINNERWRRMSAFERNETIRTSEELASEAVSFRFDEEDANP